MSKAGQQQVIKKPISLLLVEGETDEIFYKRVKLESLRDCRSTIQHNIRGLYNVNVKVINRIVDYSQQHKDEKIRAYCCLDTESRNKPPPDFDLKRIKKWIKDESITRVLSIDVITATQQIESWFFYDIEGIFEFLRIPVARRNPCAFKPPEKYGYRELQKLFERYSKTYNKGKRAENFINSLNINKIVSTCEELRKGIGLIKSQADDMTSHLFTSISRKSN